MQEFKEMGRKYFDMKIDGSKSLRKVLKYKDLQMIGPIRGRNKSNHFNLMPI